MTFDQVSLLAIAAIIVAAIMGDRRARKWTANGGYVVQHSSWPTAIIVLAGAAVGVALLLTPNSEGLAPINRPEYGWYLVGGLFLVIPPVVGFGRNAVFTAALINAVLLCLAFLVIPGPEQAVPLGLAAGMWPWVVVLGVVRVVAGR